MKAIDYVVPPSSLPIEPNSTGPDVAELQMRLRAAGYPTGDDPTASYLDGTIAAVRRFQIDHGSAASGTCDGTTWRLVEEAEFALGDRLLCLVSPMMRGPDVSEVQLRLGSLGFDAGRVDGIFGPATQLAVRDFQRNAGLICDDVCGPDTIEALIRLEGRAGSSTLAGVQERERLRQLRDGLTELRLAIGVAPDLPQHQSSIALRLIAELSSAVQHVGGSATVLRGTWEEQAAAANAAVADVVIGLHLREQPGAQIAYFEVPGFTSYGGHRLAGQLAIELSEQLADENVHPVGMRLPLLRETRPTAVVIEIGPSSAVDLSSAALAEALHRGINSWIAEID